MRYKSMIETVFKGYWMDGSMQFFMKAQAVRGKSPTI
jgi:hypothetical protein